MMTQNQEASKKGLNGHTIFVAIFGSIPNQIHTENASANHWLITLKEGRFF